MSENQYLLQLKNVSKKFGIGTIDEVKISTIKALSDYMTPIWGPPVVTFGTPAW